MKSEKRFNTLKHLYEEFIRGDEQREQAFKRDRENIRLGQQIFEMRTKADLTQKQLANMIDTTASVISRLENANYDGHTMNMLRRIASAFGREVRVEFPAKEVLRREARMEFKSVQSTHTAFPVRNTSTLEHLADFSIPTNLQANVWKENEDELLVA